MKLLLILWIQTFTLSHSSGLLYSSKLSESDRVLCRQIESQLKQKFSKEVIKSYLEPIDPGSHLQHAVNNAVSYAAEKFIPNYLSTPLNERPPFPKKWSDVIFNPGPNYYKSNLLNRQTLKHFHRPKDPLNTHSRIRVYQKRIADSIKEWTNQESWWYSYKKRKLEQEIHLSGSTIKFLYINFNEIVCQIRLDGKAEIEKHLMEALLERMRKWSQEIIKNCYNLISDYIAGIAYNVRSYCEMWDQPTNPEVCETISGLVKDSIVDQLSKSSYYATSKEMANQKLLAQLTKLVTDILNSPEETHQ